MYRYLLLVNISPKKLIGVIVILVPEYITSSHNNPLIYQNFKIVFNCALR